MSSLRIERVLALPGTIVGSTLYIVKSAEAGLAEVYFSNNDGSEVRHIINKGEIEALVAAAAGNISQIEIVANIAARATLAPTLTKNTLVLVVDATGDVTVAAGAALYIYDFGATTFTKVSEFESLDVNLTWANIQNKPVSSVAAIDLAVTESHTHTNKTVLDDLSDNSGELEYKGAPILAHLSTAAW